MWLWLIAKIKYIAPGLIIGIIIVVLTMFILSVFPVGCMTAPKRSDYNSDECFQEADCFYRNKDNKDKSVCSGHVEDCRKVHADRRAKANLKYCQDERPKSWSEGECQKYFGK